MVGVPEDSYGVRAQVDRQRETANGAVGTNFKQLFLVATTCPSCGTVDVWTGPARVARISLVSATTVHRKVFATPPFTTRSAPVYVKVVTSGRPVLIDGLRYRK